MDYLEPPKIEYVLYGEIIVGPNGAPDCWPSNQSPNCGGDPPDHPLPGPPGPENQS